MNHASSAVACGQEADTADTALVTRAATQCAEPNSTGGKVLVLGEDTRIVLPVIRSLGRQGLEVHVAWCPESEPAARSRYVARYHALEPWSSAPRQWLEDLKELLTDEQFDLVIPATEAAVFALAGQRDCIGHYPEIHLIHPRAFDIAFDKHRTHELARSLGVPVARGARVSVPPSDATLDTLATWNYPLAVKPVCSVDADDTQRKQFVRRAADRSELLACLEASASTDTDVLVEEWFTGEGLGVEFLAHEGKVLFAFQHRRLHETTGFGSTYRVSEPVDAALLDATRRLIHALNYTGVGMCEFRRQSAGGRWILLEINARFWGSLPLALAAGADFPWYLYQMLVEGRRDFAPEYQADVRCRNLLNDLRWMWRSLRRATAADMVSPEFDGWEMNTISRRELAAHWGRLLCCLDYVDSFAWDDARPAFSELRDVLVTTGKSILQRLRPQTRS